MTDVSLLGYQHEFITSSSKKAFLLGGIGSGKSFSGAHFAVKMLSEFPKARGLITANVYSQLMNATVQTITQEFDNLNIRYEAVLSGARKRIELDRTIIHLYSLEKPNSLRGIEVGWWLGDESAFAKHDAIKIARGRLRQRGSPLLERHTSSPNGFNWAYEEFEGLDGRNRTAARHLVRAKTQENIFLPDGYYEDLLADYGGPSNPLAIQELFGEFVNLTAGAIYWGFKRDLHVKTCKQDKSFPVYSCQDFNIDNMCNCYFQRINGHYYVFKENILNESNSNTEAAATNTVRDLGTNNVFVIPDSTARSRKTSAGAGMTDLHILESYGLQVLPTRNPLIRDRQNSVNNIFKQNKITIDPSCKSLIRELESLSSRDEEGLKSHIAVALGYGIFKFDPLTQTHKDRIIRMM